MEEILEKIDKIFSETENVGNKLEEDFEEFKIQLDNIIYGTKELSLTPQQKKKVKRLSVIADAEEIDANVSEIIVTQTDEVVIKTELIEISQATTRPSRAAKLKVQCFKEPTLNGKLRRPSQCNDTLSSSRFLMEESSVATSRAGEGLPQSVAIDSKVNTTNEITLSATTHAPPAKSKNPVQKRSLEDIVTNENSNKDDSMESIKKVDESLLIVTNGEVPIVELSDNEADKLMPPPMEIPKKKTMRKVKQSDAPAVESEPPLRSSRLRIKLEKLSMDRVQTIDKTKSNEIPTSELEKSNFGEIKQEKIEEDGTSKRGKGGKRGRKPYKCMPIKEESDLKTNDRVEKKSTESVVKETRQTRSKNDKKQPSMESVYEDAISDAVPKLIENTTQDAIISSIISNDIPPLRDVPADATFVSAMDPPVLESNATFVTTEQSFVVEKAKDVGINDKTQVIATSKALSPVDATFSVSNETFMAQPNQVTRIDENIMRSSIMTEEDSIDEVMQPPPPPQPLVLAKSKQKKELFNPVKKKVEAFEKHAYAMASPAEVRQTRTKSKLKENKDPEPSSNKHTPILKRDAGKLFTSSQQTFITPNNGMQNMKYLASSTSKLAQIQKSAKSTPTIPKTQSLQRENSVEDMKRAGVNSKLQKIADEKKKKREQKQQQAAITRENKEKERNEKLRKAIQDREEKMRRKAHEQEMRKQLEEINKNIKLQEEKREAQKRLEKKQLEQELVEAAHREREMLDNMKILKAKEELQQKLWENQRLQKEKKAKQKDALKYDFDLVNSGDSTDEEGKPNSKKPPPPVWSKSSIRQLLIERQTQLPAKIVDSFFSVQPMTPDLREIFPAIDPRYLKRNSSMYWNTPPRYSQLPKY